eukprot:evm.model.NODE_32964_length_50150_cov_18.993917.7
MPPSPLPSSQTSSSSSPLAASATAAAATAAFSPSSSWMTMFEVALEFVTAEMSSQGDVEVVLDVVDLGPPKKGVEEEEEEWPVVATGTLLLEPPLDGDYDDEDESGRTQGPSKGYYRQKREVALTGLGPWEGLVGRLQVDVEASSTYYTNFSSSSLSAVAARQSLAGHLARFQHESSDPLAAFWNLFEHETKARRGGMDLGVHVEPGQSPSQAHAALQAMLVRALKNYKLAKDAWRLVVVPAWHGLPALRGVDRDGYEVLMGLRTPHRDRKARGPRVAVTANISLERPLDAEEASWLGLGRTDRLEGDLELVSVAASYFNSSLSAPELVVEPWGCRCVMRNRLASAITTVRVDAPRHLNINISPSLSDVLQGMWRPLRFDPRRYRASFETPSDTNRVARVVLVNRLGVPLILRPASFGCRIVASSQPQQQEQGKEAEQQLHDEDTAGAEDMLHDSSPRLVVLEEGGQVELELEQPLPSQQAASSGRVAASFCHRVNLQPLGWKPVTQVSVGLAAHKRKPSNSSQQQHSFSQTDVSLSHKILMVVDAKEYHDSTETGQGSITAVALHVEVRTNVRLMNLTGVVVDAKLGRGGDEAPAAPIKIARSLVTPLTVAVDWTLAILPPYQLSNTLPCLIEVEAFQPKYLPQRRARTKSRSSDGKKGTASGLPTSSLLASSSSSSSSSAARKRPTWIATTPT